MAFLPCGLVFSLIFFYFSVLIADEMVDEGLNNAPKLSSFFTLSRSSTEVQTLAVKLNLIWCFSKKGVDA